MNNWLILSIFVLVCWGITGNTQKLSTNYISTQFSFRALGGHLPRSRSRLAAFEGIGYGSLGAAASDSFPP